MNVFGARIILPNGNGVLTALTAKKNAEPKDVPMQPLE